MILLQDLQDFTRDLVKNLTGGYFTDDLVVSDVGLQKDEIEAALTSRGWCVVVDMPMRGRTVESAPGVSLVMVTIPVLVHMNPKQNADIDVFETMGNIHDAILAYVSQSGSVNDDADRFESEDECFVLSVDDGGIITLVSFFKKLCSISAG